MVTAAIICAVLALTMPILGLREGWTMPARIFSVSATFIGIIAMCIFMVIMLIAVN